MKVIYDSNYSKVSVRFRSSLPAEELARKLTGGAYHISVPVQDILQVSIIETRRIILKDGITEDDVPNQDTE